jgi:hypothetical protein
MINILVYTHAHLLVFCLFVFLLMCLLLGMYLSYLKPLVQVKLYGSAQIDLVGCVVTLSGIPLMV